jgi:sulfate transport system substrate-binding protein
MIRKLAISLAVLGALSAAQTATAANLLNVSYDPTRELYVDVNAAFAKAWKAQGGDAVTVRQSHGGSGKQARSVIDGLDADVVTLALGYDIDAIADKGLIKPDWQKRLPHNASPYTSTIVFLVRKGNPKGIKDWGDLVKPGVSVVTPNPKTSGGARWNYLAAWTWAAAQNEGDLAKTLTYMSLLFKHVPVLDTGARGATTTFVNRGIGDVLIAWENEAFLAKSEPEGKDLEIVIPSISILAEPPVAIVDKNVDRHGTRKAAQAYLEFLYSPQGQTLAAKHHFRPANPEGVPSALLAAFPQVKTVTIDKAFGGWKKAQATHFADGAFFDQLYKPGR